MIEYYTLFLPKSNRSVKLEISGPRFRKDIKFDTLYLLDGQNAFLDSHAAFGRSIRATKVFNIAAQEMGKRILGIAIYNSGSDIGRVNEYSPFKIQNPLDDEWYKQDVEQFNNFCFDFIHTIIPFVEENYNTYKEASHRSIYGSSLAATTALYLGFKYKNIFGNIGAFSTASFLFEDEMMKFLDEHKNPSVKVFLYVGRRELSDSSCDEEMYINSSKKLYKFFKDNNTNVRLSIDINGIHDEETWGRHFIEFINFIYFEDIFYSL